MPKYSLRHDYASGGSYSSHVPTFDGLVIGGGGGAYMSYAGGSNNHNHHHGHASSPEKPTNGRRERCLRHLMHIGLALLILTALAYAVLNKTDLGHKLNESLRNTFTGMSGDQPAADRGRSLDLDKAQTIVRKVDTDVLRSTVVETKTGKLQGFVQNVTGTEVATFLSVPYGKPPTGMLRFRRTEPIDRWEGTKLATQQPPPCIQSEYTQRIFPVNILNDSITEDCLFLNIWSPTGGADDRKRSVMIFLHGGMFTIGSIGLDEYDGRMLAAVGDVVVVTVQYRLGIFGFLDLDHEQVPGNMGLFDQYTALEWVSNNIEAFGGDPNSITLFGTSAGAISIGLHMYHPNATKLFHRAILQSGSPMLLKQVYSRGEDLAVKFAEQIGCWKPGNESSIYDNPEEVIECLDRTPFEKIYKLQDDLVRDNPIPFLPTIPSDYIENFLTDYNETTTLPQKEVIMGFNKNEGALIIHAAYPKLFTRQSVPQFTKLLEVQQKVMQMGIDSGLNPGQANSIASLLINGKETDTPIKWAQTIANLFGDVMFVCPIYDFANKLEQANTSTYLYLFDQRAKNVVWGDWMQVTHHDEVNFVMGVPLRYRQEYSADDIQISELMMRTWAHFAKTGKIPTDQYEQPWSRYNSTDQPYMHLKAHEHTMGSQFHKHACELYSLFADYIS